MSHSGLWAGYVLRSTAHRPDALVVGAEAVPEGLPAQIASHPPSSVYRLTRYPCPCPLTIAPLESHEVALPLGVCGSGPKVGGEFRAAVFVLHLYDARLDSQDDCD